MADFDPEKLKSVKEPKFDPSRLKTTKSEPVETVESVPVVPVESQELPPLPPRIGYTTNRADPKQRYGDPKLFAEMPKGTLSTALGLPSDILNIPRTVESFFREPKIPEVPYGSAEIEKKLFGETPDPSKKAARELGGLLGPTALLETLKGGKYLFDVAKDIPSKAKNISDVLRGAGSSEDLERLTKSLKTGAIETALTPVAEYSPERASTVSKLIAYAPDESAIGKNMLQEIDKFTTGAKAKLKEVAESVYGKARESMDKKVAAGDYFQESSSGKNFIQSLENKLKVDDVTKVTTEERNLIQNQILPNIKGLPKEVKQPVLKFDEFGQAVPVPAQRTAYADPNVIRETLRKLRDTAFGFPEEGYKAIGQQRAGELADQLAKAVAGWDSKLAEADAIYKKQIETLHPTRTTRGKSVTATEKFDPEQLKIDPLQAPKKFFQSRQGVEQLVDLVGGNKNAVESIAETYVNNQLKGKTPSQMRDWLDKAKNSGWLSVDTLPRTALQTEKKIATLEYDALRQPIRDVVARVEADPALIEKLPSMLKSAIDPAGAGKGLPTAPVKFLNEEINRIQSIQDKEQAAKEFAKTLAKWVGIGTLTGSGVAAGYKAF